MIIYEQGTRKEYTVSMPIVQSVTKAGDAMKIEFNNRYCDSAKVKAPILVRGPFDVKKVSASDAFAFLKKFNLKKMSLIDAKKEAGITTIKFKFANGIQFSIVGGLDIGTKQVGSRALGNVLKCAGIANPQGVCTPGISSYYVERVPE